MNYSRRIRRARTVGHLTQAQLALLIGVHRSAVAQWEQANGTTPSIAHLAKIADVLEISCEWLATGRGRMRFDASYDRGERIPTDFARDEMEERILLASRSLNVHKREAVLALMESLAHP